MARKTYTGPILDVSYDIDVCRHAARCVHGMPEVFDTHRKPWIDPEVADTPEKAQKLRDVVSACPTSALLIEEHSA
ncbi:MAG: (4Fe-4S)-binding protein [Propionibacteriaceae bacterium]|jgi:uncharacterized Fe-S cluster protein YjdI|nr:(4Fe-4S)-binding protein [Propionibacteriaceae bacterium]